MRGLREARACSKDGWRSGASRIFVFLLDLAAPDNTNVLRKHRLVQTGTMGSLGTRLPRGLAARDTTGWQPVLREWYGDT